MTGLHAGPSCVLDRIARSLGQDIDLGRVLPHLSIVEQKQWGVKLVAALLRNGADLERLEASNHDLHIVHFAVMKALDTGM